MKLGVTTIPLNDSTIPIQRCVESVGSLDTKDRESLGCPMRMQKSCVLPYGAHTMTAVQGKHV